MGVQQEAVQKVLSRYATFMGRASRAEFWWWALAVLVLMLVLSVVDQVLIAPLLGVTDGQPLATLVSLGLLLPNLAVGARRLHDTGRSGWWLLIGLVPLVGFLVLLYFYVQPSDGGSNDYGAPEPLASA